MTDIDPFDKVFRDWLRGVHQDTKARQEDHRLATLVNTLQQRGDTVTFDETCFYLYVDAGTDHALTITMQNAREMDLEVLLQWVEERTK